MSQAHIQGLQADPFHLQLLKNAANSRKKIFDAFEEIPNIITEAQLRKENFPELRDLADNLNDALFLALPKLIAYLLPKTLGNDP